MIGGVSPVLTRLVCMLVRDLLCFVVSGWPGPRAEGSTIMFWVMRPDGTIGGWFWGFLYTSIVLLSLRAADFRKVTEA